MKVKEACQNPHRDPPISYFKTVRIITFFTLVMFLDSQHRIQVTDGKSQNETKLPQQYFSFSLLAEAKQSAHVAAHDYH